MSTLYMSAVWALDCEFSGRKLILLALADNANDEGICWPSIPTIARRCSCSDRTVQINLQEMEDDGWIRVRKRVGNSTVYELTIPMPGAGGEGSSPVKQLHQSPPPIGEPKPSSQPPKPKDKTEKQEAPFTIPECLDTPVFRAQWESWMRYRRKLKKHPNFGILFAGHLRRLSQFPPAIAASLLKRSEDEGYTGVVFDSDKARHAVDAGQPAAPGAPLDIATISRKRVADMTPAEREAFMRYAAS